MSCRAPLFSLLPLSGLSGVEYLSTDAVALSRPGRRVRPVFAVLVTLWLLSGAAFAAWLCYSTHATYLGDRYRRLDTWCYDIATLGVLDGRLLADISATSVPATPSATCKRIVEHDAAVTDNREVIHHEANAAIRDRLKYLRGAGFAQAMLTSLFEDVRNLWSAYAWSSVSDY
ncbi:unnamed protein product [Closterium sp. Yama58-4]|nr:unnamed protein product [Closterium sp. Yama58-4]